MGNWQDALIDDLKAKIADMEREDSRLNDLLKIYRDQCDQRLELLMAAKKEIERLRELLDQIGGTLANGLGSYGGGEQTVSEIVGLIDQALAAPKEVA